MANPPTEFEVLRFLADKPATHHTMAEQFGCTVKQMETITRRLKRNRKVTVLETLKTGRGRPLNLWATPLDAQHIDRLESRRPSVRERCRSRACLALQRVAVAWGALG